MDNHYLIFSDNYIDGQEFLSLSENDIKTMVPPLGLARKIFRLVQSTQVYLYMYNKCNVFKYTFI